MEHISSLLPQAHPWGGRILEYDTLPSTSTLAKELAAQGAPEGTVIVAGHQSAGRGRMGRSFSSPEGLGLYLSVILRPNCSPGRLMHLTCAVGLAACDAVEAVAGFRPGLKWANDLVWNRQKLGGILVENSLDERGNIAWAVVGIGINCAQTPADFPEALRPTAASLAMATGQPVSRRELAVALVSALEKMNRQLFQPAPIMARYRRDCVTLGQVVSVHSFRDIRHAKALAVDDAGALILEFEDGHRETVNSGEVSVRGMYGYT